MLYSTLAGYYRLSGLRGSARQRHQPALSYLSQPATQVKSGHNADDFDQAIVNGGETNLSAEMRCKGIGRIVEQV